jgi:hypothetical protein
MRFKILKTGLFKDSKGQEHNITEETLEKISAEFERKKEEIPIVVGHPKSSSPAFGWVGKVEKIGKELWAETASVAEKFVDAIKGGFYKNRSIAFNPTTFEPIHVGFLGGAAPAVPGLGDVAFEGEENPIVEFDGEEGDIITDAPTETKEKTVPEAEFAALQQQLAELKTENDNLNKQISVMLGDKRAAEFNAMIDGLITAGKVLPAERDSLTKLFATLDKASVEFSAEDENNPLRAFQESLQARPVMLSMKPIDAPIITPVEEKPVPGSAAAIKLAMQE